MNFFLTTLPWWGWLILAAVPPAIVLLYFLKLKRIPIEVPSTFLWKRAIEDLHVNTIWQRLRRNILLFLQLLLLFLIILAVLRPSRQANNLVGNRFILMIDNSASMSATDVGPSRLEEAKKQARGIIDEMRSGDAAMILSFSDQSNIVQSYSDNRAELRSRLDSIQPSQRRTQVDDALRYAAGLANPGRSSYANPSDSTQPSQDQAVAEAQPATVYLFSDGGFAAVPDFFLGNLDPKFIPIGKPQPDNVGIVSLATERNAEKPDQLQAFVRLENVNPEPVEVEIEVYLNDEKSPRDVAALTLPGAQSTVDNATAASDAPAEGAAAVVPPRTPGSAGADFDLSGYGLESIEHAWLRVRINRQDDFALDNVAYVALNAPRPANILLVSPGNPLLETVLTTPASAKISTLRIAEPAVLMTEKYQEEARGGAYDLIIYDRCSPQESPSASTLYIGAIPPGDGWKKGEKQGPPALLDWDRLHPLMQLIELGNVLFVEGFEVTPPPGGKTLIESQFGAVFAIAPRDGYEDAVLGMEILSTSKEGAQAYNTNWYQRLSFPIFFQNLIRHQGGGRTAIASDLVRPGDLVRLQTALPQQYLMVTPPGGSPAKVEPQGKTLFPFSRTDRLGIYEVRDENSPQLSQLIAVNLFDGRESNLQPRTTLQFGATDVRAEAVWETQQVDYWKWIVLLGLVVLLAEWWIFNQRVYL
ncbi:vWA domain-containing protein [Lignipirellula cremea]|uniref:VWFA domain-containing protein n=1 Tax=Lignipirellula cremea TaxID=2528010 RepID=A0A518DU86_9BACT|nr:BatA and WFA domain-containing protein [Lignipirellula cremea]QDU95395.1 hypothetical protein Pla8534_32100 [Lignipirellula cremea]